MEAIMGIAPVGAVYGTLDMDKGLGQWGSNGPRKELSSPTSEEGSVSSH